MLKKSINSAIIYPIHVNAALALSYIQRKSISLRAMAVWSLRLWTFFITFAPYFQTEYVMVR